jgi:hypothetical protein
MRLQESAERHVYAHLCISREIHNDVRIQIDALFNEQIKSLSIRFLAVRYVVSY